MARCPVCGDPQTRDVDVSDDVTIFWFTQAQRAQAEVARLQAEVDRLRVEIYRLTAGPHP